MLQAKSSGKLDGVLRVIQGQDKRAIADIFKSKEGQLLKQANMAIESFKKIGEKWPEISRLIEGDGVTLQDLNSIQQILNKEFSGGFFKKLSQNFGVTTKPYPGLEPQTIIRSLFVVIEDAVEKQGDQEINEQVSSDDVLSSVLKAFRTNFEKLYNYSQSGTITSTRGVRGTDGADPTVGTAPNTNEKQATTSTTQTTGTEDETGILKQEYDEQILDDISTKLNSRPEQINKILQALLGAGYKVEKIN